MPPHLSRSMTATRIGLSRTISIAVAVCVLNDYGACANVTRRERVATTLVNRCFDVESWVGFEETDGLEHDAKVLGRHPEGSI
jgi:hypothetical protein